MSDNIIAFPSIPRTTHRASEANTVIPMFSDAVARRAARPLAALVAARALVGEWDVLSARARDDADRAKAAARHMMAEAGQNELGSAMSSKAARLSRECARVAQDRVQAVEALHAAERAAGAAIAMLPRQQAREAYAATFPGLSPQKAGAAVSALIRDHRAALRYARKAV